MLSESSWPKKKNRKLEWLMSHHVLFSLICSAVQAKIDDAHFQKKQRRTPAETCIIKRKDRCSARVMRIIVKFGFRS